MDVLRQLGAAVGWISGSLAFLTGVLFALGFFTTLANQRMLGLTWSNIVRDPLWYPGLGGQVFAYWALPATIILIALVALGQGMAWCVRRAGASRRPAIARAADFSARHRTWFLAALAVGCAFMINRDLGQAMNVSGLLFMRDELLCDPNSDIALLAGGDSIGRDLAAGTVVVFASLALGLLAIATPAHAAGRAPLLPLAVLAVVASHAVIAIPFAYGTLVMQPSLRTVHFHPSLEAELPPNPLYLVAAAQDGIWLWEPKQRSVHWFSSQNYTHMRFGATVPIYGIACLCH